MEFMSATNGSCYLPATRRLTGFVGLWSRGRRVRNLKCIWTRKYISHFPLSCCILMVFYLFVKEYAICFYNDHITTNGEYGLFTQSGYGQLEPKLMNNPRH